MRRGQSTSGELPLVHTHEHMDNYTRDMQGIVWGEPELTSTYSCMALQAAHTLRKETLCVMRQSFTLVIAAIGS